MVNDVFFPQTNLLVQSPGLATSLAAKILPRLPTAASAAQRGGACSRSSFLGYWAVAAIQPCWLMISWGIKKLPFIYWGFGLIQERGNPYISNVFLIFSLGKEYVHALKILPNTMVNSRSEFHVPWDLGHWHPNGCGSKAWYPRCPKL